MYLLLKGVSELKELSIRQSASGCFIKESFLFLYFCFYFLRIIEIGGKYLSFFQGSSYVNLFFDRNPLTQRSRLSQRDLCKLHFLFNLFKTDCPVSSSHPFEFDPISGYTFAFKCQTINLKSPWLAFGVDLKLFIQIVW